MTGISNLTLLMFSLIAIIFILSLITPLLKGLTDTVGTFVGSKGTERLASGIKYAMDMANEKGNYHTTYRLILGKGFYYIGTWPSSGFGVVCGAQDFCVNYIAPKYNATDVVNAIKSNDQEGVFIIKGSVAFKTGDYGNVVVNGDESNRGVLFYVDGIKYVYVDVSVVKNTTSYNLNIAVVRGASWFEPVKS